jgi:uncharacterized SAM-binding protein YcdF (DUF218 family)
MIIFILLALLVVALVVLRIGLRTSFGVLFALIAVATLVIGCGLVPEQMLRNLQAGYADAPPQPWQPRTAIIVLGGGLQRNPDTRALQVPPLVAGRVVKGAELYRQCKQAGGACVVLVSGGDPEKSGDSEAHVYATVLENIGVDPTDIALEAKSMSTWQNAQFCAVWLAAHPQDRVLLATSGLHVRRSLLYFAHFGVHAFGVRSDYERAEATPFPQAYNFFLTDLALHEYVGLARYHVYELLGLNAPAVP